MSASEPTFRSLFVEPLLVIADEPASEPGFRYDEGRDLSVLETGLPVVEAIRAAGTHTVTHADGERDDADEMSLHGGTMTYTAIKAEREDDDMPAAWGGTQLDTRRFPGDVEHD